MLLQFLPESELNLIEQSSRARKQHSNGGDGVERSMVAEAWKKEIALIYLPLIGEDRCIVPSGVKINAVCQLMGTRVKRCQVVGGHQGGGQAPKGVGARGLEEVARPRSTRPPSTGASARVDDDPPRRDQRRRRELVNLTRLTPASARRANLEQRPQQDCVSKQMRTPAPNWTATAIF